MTYPVQIARAAPVSLDEIARKLTAAQKRNILSLSAEWGPAVDSRCARRMFWSKTAGPLVKHRHKTNNCWALTDLGLQVRELLIADGILPPAEMLTFKREAREV